MSPSEIVAIATVLIQDAPFLLYGNAEVVVAAQTLVTTMTDNGYELSDTEQGLYDQALGRYQGESIASTQLDDIAATGEEDASDSQC